MRVLQAELLPEVQLAVVHADFLGAENRVETGLLLLDVVSACSIDDLAEDNAGGDIDKAHESHENVSDAPDKAHAQAAANEDQQCADNIEAHHEALAGHLTLVDEGKSVVAVIEVADKGGEAEEHQCRNKNTKRCRNECWQNFNIP